MNDQNETAQLRFLEETATRLRQNGFTVEPIKDHHLPVCWEKGRLCRVSGKGSVLYRQENVDSIRAQDALQTVIDIAKMTSEYMAILETAPRLKASGLDGDYRILADLAARCWQVLRANTAFNSSHGIGTMTARVWYTDTTSWRTTMPPSRTSPHAPGLSKRSSFSARSS